MTVRLRIALAQVNPCVGDLDGNAEQVRATVARAAGAGAQLVAFPEMMLTGYPVEDLVFRESFVAASRAGMDRLASQLADDGLGGIATIIGYLDADGPARISAEAAAGRGPRNTIAVAYQGRVVATYFKHHLPNYGVFDEDRYFVPGSALQVVRIGGVDVALTICEDIWQAGGPFAAARRAGVGLVVNINGSPYELHKDDVRQPLVAKRAGEAGAAVAYVNMIGGQDELVFDGDSMVVDVDGTLLARSPQFAEDLLVIDLDLPAASGPGVVDPIPGADGMTIAHAHISDALPVPVGPAPERTIAPYLTDEAEIWRALVCGLRDYVRKNGFRSVVLGAVRRHRLGGGRGDRLRRDRRGQRGRRVDAQRVLLGTLPGRRGRPGQAHRPGLSGRADRADGRRVHD